MNRQDHITAQKVAEGAVSRKEFDAFQGRMREEPELVELYRGYSLLEHTLCEEFEGMPLRRAGSIAPTGNGWVVAGGFAAAAALALLAAVLWMRPEPAVPVVSIPSRMEFSEDAIWSFEGKKNRVDGLWTMANGGVLELAQGRVEISLAGGGTGLVEGPARVRVDAPGKVFLAEGRGFFRLEEKGAELAVETPSLRAVDLGTAFGVSANKDKPDELHVMEGMVRLEVGGRASGKNLVAGDGASVGSGLRVERFAVADNSFPETLGDFKTVLGGELKAADWRVDKGAPEVKYGVISGSDFEAFRKLPGLEDPGSRAVVLATLETMDPEDGAFHSGNWAGMSFFNDGEEILFFGDSYGDVGTWSLDLKQDAPVILPETNLPGARKVTMRYDARTGLVTLHEGGLPLAAPFCRGWLDAGQTFDEVRLGAAYGAAIAVKGAEVRIKP